MGTLSRRELLLAALGFTLLSLLVVWPLPLHLSTHVVGWPGDNLYFVWLVEWYKRSLEAGQSPFGPVPQFNYPAGWHIAYNEPTPAMSVPFAWLGGVLGYNVSLLFSFILSGLFTYGWTKRLTGNAWAASFAGVAFAISPYRMAHLAGHLNLMGTQWLPLCFWAWWESSHRTRWAWKPVLGGAVGIGLLALTSVYYVYMAGVVSVVFVPLCLLLQRTAWRLRLALLAATVGLSLPLVALAATPFLSLTATFSPRTLDETRMWSASPLDFVTPPSKHFLWGGNYSNIWVEDTLYLGIVAILLSLVALALRPLPAVGPHRRVALVLALSAGATLLLALGVELRWQPETPTEIWLPGRWLFENLPFYAGMRVWMRYGIFTILLVSVLAGLGLHTLQGRVRRKTALALLALGLMVGELYTGFQPLTAAAPRPIDVWLAQQPGAGALLEMPLERSYWGQASFYALTHGKPTIGSFSAHPTPQMLATFPVLAQFPAPASLTLLTTTLDVRWLLVQESRYPDFAALQATLAAAGYQVARPATNAGGVWVFVR